MANKKRLIDANAIPWKKHYVPDGDTQWEYKKEQCVCKSAIDQMPTVDAVEVVRCKDCKHCVHLSKKYKCDIACEKLHTDSIYLDFWCRYGERKDHVQT